MSPDMSALPDDVDALRAIVAAQAAELLAKDGLIGTLRLQLERLRRMQFGRSSERMEGVIAQLELALEDLEAEAAGTGPGAAESDNAIGAANQVAPAKAKPARRRLPTTCHVMLWSIRLQAPAPRAAAACARWART